MIEIAISLAVIGFALVAIIGILPTGMNVQKENRQETVINQDVTILMNAMRGGAQGLDELTNYVLGITNSMTLWLYTGSAWVSNSHYELSYTYTGSTNSSSPTSPQFALTNGARIVGLLSTPRMVAFPGGVWSNYVVAAVRSISGAASEKSPQTNSDVMDLGLSYRLISEVSPYQDYDTNWTRIDPAFGAYCTNLQANLQNIRLTFRWPLFADGSAGNNRQIFRTMAGGRITTNMEASFAPQNPVVPFTTLYFVAPRTYARAQ
jgi:hypothetical protein